MGVLAELGPAATLVAIQWQLAQISRLVERNIALTSTVLRLVRGEQWAADGGGASGAGAQRAGPGGV